MNESPTWLQRRGIGLRHDITTTPRQLVSFPKSGRTWIRYILSQLHVDNQICFHHDGFGFSDHHRPTLDFNLPRRLREYAHVEKLVYLHRDPRDVMVSFYHQITGRMKEKYGYQGTISDFLRDDYFGAAMLHRFQQMWHQIVAQRGFLAVSYEECHQNTQEVIGKILSYFNLDVPADQLHAAVAQGDFESMKRVEQSGTFPEPWLNPRNGAPKVREGKISGFREALSPEDIAYLNQQFGLPE